MAYCLKHAHAPLRVLAYVFTLLYCSSIASCGINEMITLEKIMQIYNMESCFLRMFGLFPPVLSFNVICALMNLF